MTQWSPEALAEQIHNSKRTIQKNHRNNERLLIELVKEKELQIDDSGRVWRIKIRYGLRSGGSALRTINKKRAENKGWEYLRVSAMRDGHRIHCLAHRLIWQNFFGDIPDGLCINHKNGKKFDNRPSNLELVTYSQNSRHARRTGLLDQSGEKNPASKLTDEQVVKIRRMYINERISQTDIAKEFAVSFQTISDIIRGKTRTKQGGPACNQDNRFSGNRRLSLKEK